MAQTDRECTAVESYTHVTIMCQSCACTLYHLILLHCMVCQVFFLLITYVALKGNWKLIQVHLFIVTCFRFNCLCKFTDRASRPEKILPRIQIQQLQVSALFLILLFPWLSHRFRTHEANILLFNYHLKRWQTGNLERFFSKYIKFNIRI